MSDFDSLEWLREMGQIHEEAYWIADELAAAKARIAELEEQKVILNRFVDELEADIKLLHQGCRDGEELFNELAKHEAVEPVAWMHVQGNYKEPRDRPLDDWEEENGWECYPLYSQPPSTQAAVAAALRKAAEVCRNVDSEFASVSETYARAILAIPHDDSHLRELMIDAVIEAKIQFGTSMTNKAIVARVLKC